MFVKATCLFLHLQIKTLSTMNLKTMATALVLSVAAFSSVKAQSLDEIVSKYLDARGGTEKLRSITSMIQKGNLNANGMKIPITLTVVAGKGMRQEYTVNGMTGYSIMTADGGWNYNPFMGQTKAEPMTADELKSNPDALDPTDDLLDYASKGSTAEYLGKEDVEGSECYKIKLTMKGGKEKTYYISTEDNMLIKTSEKYTADGKEQTNDVMYANYKEVNGIQFPFSVSAQFGPVDMDTIELNTSVDDSVFKPAN